MDSNVNNADLKKEEVDYEKLSYDPFTYRQVQRIRKKGLQHGVTVPKLNFQLTKPERKRKSLLVMGIMSGAVFIVILGLLIALYVVAIKTNTTLNLGEMFANMFNPSKIVVTLGLSALGGFGIILFYLLLALLLLLPIALVYYMYKFIRTIFALSNASKEEFAKGHRVKKYIGIFLVMAIICVVLFGVVLSSHWTVVAKAILSVVLIMFASLMLAYTIILIKEKKKCLNWFSSISEERQRDYIIHDTALVKSNMRTERNNRIDTTFWR